MAKVSLSEFALGGGSAIAIDVGMVQVGDDTRFTLESVVQVRAAGEMIGQV